MPAAPAPRRRPRWDRLRERMDALASTFGIEHVSPDPLEVVLRHADPSDREVAGFLCAALAFGSARGAVRSGEDLLARLGGPPAAAVREWPWTSRPDPRLRGWRHRWLGERDASAVLSALGRILREHGSLARFFAAGDPSAGRRDGDIAPALSSFCERALSLVPPGAPPRVAYWFSGPAKGGTAKRLCLWLRWMCRRDAVDPGPWTLGPTSVDPSRLVIPLDVHVARIARYCGLLRRRTSDWRAAVELTARLRTFDPADPVRYDFALCRLGILGTCPRRRERRRCAECPLFEVCLL